MAAIHEIDTRLRSLGRYGADGTHIEVSRGSFRVRIYYSESLGRRSGSSTQGEETEGRTPFLIIIMGQVRYTCYGPLRWLDTVDS